MICGIEPGQALVRTFQTVHRAIEWRAAAGEVERTIYRMPEGWLLPIQYDPGEIAEQGELLPS